MPSDYKAWTGQTYDRKTGYKTSSAGSDSMGMATAMAIGAGVSALSNIYGAKKAASVQEKALNQAQSNLEKDAKEAKEAWGAWYERQAPIMQTRNNALMARLGKYRKPPEGTPDMFTPEFRGWPSASSQAPQGAQPQAPQGAQPPATMASISSPQYAQMGIREGGAGPIPMQRGGVVTQPTVALIGEAGPEAVVPLSGAGRTDTGPFAWGQGSSGGRMGDIGGGVMPLPSGPWGGGRDPMPPGGGGGPIWEPMPPGGGGGPLPDWPPPPGPPRGGPLPDWPPPPGPPREGPLPDWPPPPGPPRDYPSPMPGPPRDYPSPMPGPPRDTPGPTPGPPRDTPGPPREGPLPDRREPTREDRRRQSDRLARERRQLRQRQKGGGMTPPTDFSA